MIYNGTCPNCDGKLRLEEGRSFVDCPYCGSRIPATQLLGKKDRLMKNAETNMQFGEFRKARALFKEMTEEYPDDYRGWIGLVRIDTDGFTRCDLSDQDFACVCEYIRKANICAADAVAQTIGDQWAALLKKRQEFLDERQARYQELGKRLAKNDEMLSNLQKSRQALNDHIESLEKAIRHENNALYKAIKTGQAVGLFIFSGIALALNYYGFIHQFFLSPLLFGVIAIVIAVVIIRLLLKAAHIQKMKQLEQDLQNAQENLAVNQSKGRDLSDDSQQTKKERDAIEARYPSAAAPSTAA
ncbi:MAG: hypothetical protein IJU16_07400 [Clostridia bacterium]|nr:hypothetical protein [Clostridia bacterium]